MKPVECAEAKMYQGRAFPLALGPDDEASAAKAVAADKAKVLQLAMDHGAVLLRGFDVKVAEDFADTVDALALENMPYVGGAAVRTNVVRDVVFTANESPPSEPIPFHHEMAQVPKPPHYVMFYCETPAETGGETPILLSNEVYKRFSAEFADTCRKCEELGIRYIRTMPCEDDPTSAIGRSWKNTFQCKTQAEAEVAMRAIGTEWEWLANGDLKTTTDVVPATRCDPRTGKRTFFNAMVAAFTGWVDSRNDPVKAVVYGDGSPMDAAPMLAMDKYMQEECVAFKWQKGDILIVDNQVAMHARKPFSGARRILAAVTRGPVVPHTQEAISLRSGDRLPQAGFGFWKVPKNVTAQVVIDAIKSGYRHLDCACDYGNEKEVGDGIRQAIAQGLVTRRELWVTSKLWVTYHKRAHVPLAAQRSLEDLGLDYFDLYLVHFPIALKFVPFETRYPPEWVHDPSADTPRMEFAKVPFQETWRAMEDLVTSGVARNIGVCNMGTYALRDLLSYAKIKPAVLQVELHPYNTQQKLVRFCKESQIAVTAFSPLAHASYVEISMASEGDSAMNETAIKGIAAAHKKTPAQIILRWGVQRGTAIVPKTSKPERMAENIAIFDFTLSEEEMAAVDALDKGRRFNDPGVFTLGMNTFCPIYE